MEEVFQRAVEVADIVRQSSNERFGTTATRICKHFGFHLAVSDDETVRHTAGLTMKTADGDIVIQVQGLSEDLQHRFVFYHELAHSLFHINLLRPPDVTPDTIIDFSEAEAWLFSVACAAYDGLSPTKRDLPIYLSELSSRLDARSWRISESVLKLFHENWHPLTEQTQQLALARPLIINANEALLRKIAEDPKLIFGVSGDNFEDLMAELFDGIGYFVEQTQKTRDGGVDIIAVKSMDDVSLRFLIELKRYAPHRKVGVALVRSLFGVKHHLGASKAIIATTSDFTQPAARFANAHKWDLELKAFEGIMKWIALYERIKSGPTTGRPT